MPQFSSERSLMRILTPLLRVDTSVFLFIDNHFHVPILNENMRAITYLGNGWVVYWVALLGLYLWGRPPFRRSFAALLASQIVPGAVVIAIKRLVNRPRPIVALAARIQAGTAHVVVLGRHLTAYSFPSGHTETAFALAVALSYFMPRKKAFFYTLAALVGFSRVYNGEHFSLDVIAGALVGYAGAKIGLALFERVRKARTKQPIVPEEAEPVPAE
jgi:undecaprenyl-diphosphatase